MRHKWQADLRPPQSPKIRGWLLLAALGVALLPLRLAEFIAADLLTAFSKDVWTLLTTPGTEAYHPLNAPILLFELVGNLILLVASLVLAVLFFQKRRVVPILAVSVLGALLVCGIAVPYFLVSRRVKETFVR